MTRRRMRPLNMIRTGSPTLEDRTKRPVTRRFMRHLTSGATPPPIPLFGNIQRMMIPTAIADYEGLATASWTSGVTGNFAGAANSSWNCLYYHATTSNAQTNPISAIMQPIRWSIACPPTSGGRYDWWVTPASNRHTLQYLANVVNDGSGTIALSTGNVGMNETLLTSTHFAEFKEGFAELVVLPLWNVNFGRYPGASYTETTLNAISAITYTPTPLASIHAIRHRVNGTAVGTLQIQPPVNRTFTDAWRVDISPGDSYEIDVWYKLNTASTALPSAAKAYWYIPTTRVLNGSRRPTVQVPNFPMAVFRNVNFSPAFNYTEQTYNVTISGHSGYTLKDGSDGPHKMVSGGGWTASIQNGRIEWTKSVANGYVNKIAFDWARELPHLEFWIGPLHSLWGGVSRPIYYRPSVSGYRSSTQAIDIGTITHSQMASYNQAGTSDFFQVATSQPFRPGSDQLIEGRTGPPPSFATDLPTMITISRTTQ